MSTGFTSSTGLASGLPVDSIVTQLIALDRRPIDLLSQQKTKINNQESIYQNLKSRMTALSTSLRTLIAPSVIDTNLFKKKSASSSDTSVATVSATADAATQSIALKVTQLATPTSATTIDGVGAKITAATPIASISSGSITNGNFSVFANGNNYQIAVNNGDTVGDVLGRIQAQTGILASVNNGKVVLDYGTPAATNVSLGASGDTTNFLSKLRLQPATDSGTTLTSGTVSLINTTADVTNNALANFQTAVTAGSTFQIGTATFTTNGKSLNQIISDINSSATSGVTASFNSATNKIQLISKTPGNSLITLTDTTGNFLQATGLIDGGGSPVTSQTAGKNAQFSVNGVNLQSTTNTISSDVSGLSGVTINLLNITSGTNTVSLNIAQDTDSLKSAIIDLVAKYNEVNKYIKSQTDSQSASATLKGDTTVQKIRNTLRSTAFGSVSGITSTYNSFNQLGLSTGAVGATTGTTTDLVFDSAKFDAALAANPTDVQATLTGPNGILTQLQTYVSGTLKIDADNSKKGLFQNHTDTVTARIKQIDTAVQRGNDLLVKKEASLRARFAAMEKLISQYQSQGTAITNLNAQLAANNSNK
ncbi:MAG: flagellar filament capping protein FliD [Cyanobacteria bacterium]|nr:flagellar filament capping protein FliD [Cyanobacteriota bacterium]